MSWRFVDPRCEGAAGLPRGAQQQDEVRRHAAISAEYNGDGMARPSAIVFGTYTGRMTYASSQGKGVNQADRLRAPPGEARQGVPLDHRRAARLHAHGVRRGRPGIPLDGDLSGDETMLQLCQPGEDPHSYMGAQHRRARLSRAQAAVKADDEQDVPTEPLPRQSREPVAALRTYPKTCAQGRAGPVQHADGAARGAAHPSHLPAASTPRCRATGTQIQR
jgi:hypothetical protein